MLLDKLAFTENKSIFNKYYDMLGCIDKDNENQMFQLIIDMIELKIPLIEQDPFENSVALGLVYGHTLGHAIEMSSKGKINHGAAVGFGMYYASLLGRKLNLGSPNLVHYHKELLDKLGLKLSMLSDISIDEVISQLLHDKKMYSRKVRFSILKDIGEISKDGNNYYHYIDKKDVEEVIYELFDEVRKYN